MMSTDYLLPGYWNPDISVATSAMNRPRLFTHWVPRLQTLNESSLSKLHQQPTDSRLKFIEGYLEGARRVQDKEYASVSLGMLASTHTRDNSTHPSSPRENITTGVASSSCTDSSPHSRHLPCPVVATLIPSFSQSSDLDSPTNSASTLFSETTVEESCHPEHLPQKTFRDDAGDLSSSDALSVSIAGS